MNQLEFILNSFIQLTNVLTPYPVAPFGFISLSFSVQHVPAMSMCAQGMLEFTNSFRNKAF